MTGVTDDRLDALIAWCTPGGKAPQPKDSWINLTTALTAYKSDRTALRDAKPALEAGARHIESRAANYKASLDSEVADELSGQASTIRALVGRIEG
jgi:hypothetical protein